MKNTKAYALWLGVGLLAMVGSCTTEEVGTAEDIDDGTLAKIEAMGYSTQGAVRYQEQDPIVGTRTGFLLEGDLKMDEDFLAQVEEHELEGEQFRSTNLITGLPRTLIVLGYTGGSYALDPAMQNGLQMAIENYNSLGLTLNFKLAFGTNTALADIVVYTTGTGAGGASGMPSGGNPYPYVQVFPGTSLYGLDVLEHTFTHHIGHCIGMAHTDYWDPNSCAYNPSTSAVHIPGTPTVDTNSIWNACFTAATNGEFSFYDEVALNYLY